MSDARRRFDPSELDLQGDPEGAELLATARDLESYASTAPVAPSVGFEDRVMAAIADEPMPRAGGRGFVATVRDAWAIAFGPGRPAALRAQAFAMLLALAVAVGSVGTVAVVGAARLLGQEPPPPTVPTPAPTPSMVPSTTPSPSVSPTPTPSVAPTASPRATETVEPSGTDDNGGGSGSGSGSGSGGRATDDHGGGGGSGSDDSSGSSGSSGDGSDDSSGSGSGSGETESESSGGSDSSGGSGSDDSSSGGSEPD